MTRGRNTTASLGNPTPPAIRPRKPKKEEMNMGTNHPTRSRTTKRQNTKREGERTDFAAQVWALMKKRGFVRAKPDPRKAQLIRLCRRLEKAWAK